MIEQETSEQAGQDEAEAEAEADAEAEAEAQDQVSPGSECSSRGVVSLMMHRVEEELGEYIASLGRRVELVLERSDQLWYLQASLDIVPQIASHVAASAPAQHIVLSNLVLRGWSFSNLCDPGD